MNDTADTQLMTRAAWLYYVGGINQQKTSERLGITRARVNKLLQQARESGIVSITINDREVGLLPVEESIAKHFRLTCCICTPQLGLEENTGVSSGDYAEFPRRAVGAAAATYLRQKLASQPDMTVGTGWGRTLEQVPRHLAGFDASAARFVSLMGSLTANSAFNPFEVVQALARATSAEGYYLPVPFVADSHSDRNILMKQSTVSKPLKLARHADMALISIGELTEHSLLRRQRMITQAEVRSLRKAGAVGDTTGIFFNKQGKAVDHPLNQRTLGVGFDALKRSKTVILSAGFEKIDALHALLNSGVATGLIIDGDSALALSERF